MANPAELVLHDPHLRIWVLERSSLRTCHTLRGDGAELVAVPGTGTGFASPRFVDGIHPSDAHLALGLLQNPPWRTPGWRGAVRIPVYRRFMDQHQLDQFGHPQPRRVVADGDGPNQFWAVFECVGWVDAGPLMVVAERPQLMQAANTAARGGGAQEPNCASFSSFSPLTASLDTRPAKARGEGSDDDVDADDEGSESGDSDEENAGGTDKKIKTSGKASKTPVGEVDGGGGAATGVVMPQTSLLQGVEVDMLRTLLRTDVAAAASAAAAAASAAAAAAPGTQLEDSTCWAWKKRARDSAESSSSLAAGGSGGYGDPKGFLCGVNVSYSKGLTALALGALLGDTAFPDAATAARVGGVGGGLSAAGGRGGRESGGGDVYFGPEPPPCPPPAPPPPPPGTVSPLLHSKAPAFLSLTAGDARSSKDDAALVVVANGSSPLPLSPTAAAAALDAELWVTRSAKKLRTRKRKRRRALGQLPRWSLVGSLKFLDLSFTGLSDGACAPLAACLAHPAGDLRLVNLCGNFLGVPGCAFLAGGLAANGSLRKLLLSGNSGIGDDGTKHLAEGLRCHPTIKEVRLDSCNVGLGGAFALGGRVVRHNGSLEKLGLDSNHLGSDGFTLLQTAAAAAPKGTLVSLDCQNNGINEFMSPGWRVLARRLGLQGAPHCRLRALNLSGNALNDAGLGSLASVLPLFPHLESLDLGNNLLGIRGVYPLMRAIPFTEIKDLNLQGNPLDAPSTWALAYTLSHDSALEHVNLEGTSLAGRNAAAGHLAVAVLSNAKSSLKSIQGPKLASALRGIGITTKWDQGNLLSAAEEVGGGGAEENKHQRPADELSNTEVLTWIREMRRAAADHELAIQDHKEAQQDHHDNQGVASASSASGNGGGGGNWSEGSNTQAIQDRSGSGGSVTDKAARNLRRSNSSGSRRKKSVLPPPPNAPASSSSSSEKRPPSKRQVPTKSLSPTAAAEGVLEVSADGAFDLDHVPTSTGRSSGSQSGGKEGGRGFNKKSLNSGRAGPSIDTDLSKSMNEGLMVEDEHAMGRSSSELGSGGVGGARRSSSSFRSESSDGSMLDANGEGQRASTDSVSASGGGRSRSGSGSSVSSSATHKDKVARVGSLTDAVDENEGSFHQKQGSGQALLHQGQGSQQWVDKMMAYDAFFDPVAYLAANPGMVIEEPPEEPPPVPTTPTGHGVSGVAGGCSAGNGNNGSSSAVNGDAPPDKNQVGDDEDAAAQSLMWSTPAPIRPLILSGVPAQIAHFLAETAAPPGTVAPQPSSLSLSTLPSSSSSPSSPRGGSVVGGNALAMEPHGGNTATSMLELQKFIAFDEEEFKTFINLFRLDNPAGHQRGGSGKKGKAAPEDENTNPALERAKDFKTIAARQRIKRREADKDGVASTARRRAAKLKRMRLLVEAGVFADGEDACVLDECWDDPLDSAFRSQQPRTGSNDSASGAGGGGLLGKGLGKGKEASSSSTLVPTWSAAMFDLDAFPQLRGEAERHLRERQDHEALACMREMFYSNLYRGAGGWFTKRVLVVDDSKVMRNILKRLLQKQGYATDEAPDGATALALMQQRFYDVAFMDLEMPVMDGIDCATALREWERSIGRAHRQRICAVSSHTAVKENRALSAGFDHYESKPIRHKCLLEIASARDLSPPP